jgi:hypothetical protein
MPQWWQTQFDLVVDGFDFFEHMLKFSMNSCIAIFIAALGANTYAAENCALEKPPIDSAVNAVHGKFLFIYPRKIKNNYSGCQLIWNQKGEIIISINFKNGILFSYEENLHDKNSRLICIYKNNSFKDLSEKCPESNEIKYGFKALEKSYEPLVPIEIDPRF